MTNNKEIYYKFFTKNIGFSKGIYKGLNCGISSKDNPSDVMKNINYAKKQINSSDKIIVMANQSHSNKCIILNKASDNIGSADGLVTKSSELVLGITTADCIPLIFFDNQNGIIGICHAGWKGLSNGIIENTIEKMIKIGSSTQFIKVIIGPCIRQYSYEVNNDFLNKFNLPKNNPYSSLKKNKLFFNLPKFATNILKKYKLSSIKDFKKDTYMNSDYFSYRQSKFKKQSDYGRNISLVTIK